MFHTPLYESTTENHDALQQEVYSLVERLKDNMQQGDYVTAEQTFHEISAKQKKVRGTQLRSLEIIPADYLERTYEYFRILTADSKQFAVAVLLDILGSHPVYLEQPVEPRKKIKVDDAHFSFLVAYIRGELEDKISYFRTADKIRLYQGLKELIAKHLFEHNTLGKWYYQNDIYVDDPRRLRDAIFCFLVDELDSDSCGSKPPFVKLPLFEYCDLNLSDKKRELLLHSKSRF